MVEGPPDVVRPGPAFEHGEETRLEALDPERDARHPAVAQEPGNGRRDGFRVRLDRDLLRPRKRGE
jgi:hypothetical protein